MFLHGDIQCILSLLHLAYTDLYTAVGIFEGLNNLPPPLSSLPLYCAITHVYTPTG